MSVWIEVETTVNAPLEKVWHLWTEAEHIQQWCHATDDWHVPFAENNLEAGKTFKTRMAAKDGSAEFDFEGTYTLVTPLEYIEYQIADGRKVCIWFSLMGEYQVHIREGFEAEQMNEPALQQAGWQSILDSFRRYAERTT